MGLDVIPKFYQTEFIETIMPAQRIKTACLSIFRKCYLTKLFMSDIFYNRLSAP